MSVGTHSHIDLGDFRRYLAEEDRNQRKEAQRRAQEFIEGIGPYYGNILDERLAERLPGTKIEPEIQSEEEQFELQGGIQRWLERRLKESFKKWMKNPLTITPPEKDTLLQQFSSVIVLCVETKSGKEYRISLNEDEKKGGIGKTLRSALELHIMSVAELAKQYHEERILSNSFTNSSGYEDSKGELSEVQYGRNRTFFQWDLDEKLCGSISIRRAGVAPEVEFQLLPYHGDELSRFKALHDFKQHISQDELLTGYPLEKFFEAMQRLGVSISVNLEPLLHSHTNCGNWSISPLKEMKGSELRRYQCAYLAGTGEAVARSHYSEYEIVLNFSENRSTTACVYRFNERENPILIFRAPTPLNFSYLRQSFISLLKNLELLANKELDATELLSEVIPSQSGTFRAVYASDLLIAPDAHLTISIGPGEERRQTVKRIHVVRGGTFTLERDSSYNEDDFTSKSIVQDLYSEAQSQITFDSVIAEFKDCALHGEITGDTGALESTSFVRCYFARAMNLLDIICRDPQSLKHEAYRFTQCRLKKHGLLGGYSLCVR